MRIDDGSTSIARLRLRTAGIDPLPGRLRLEALLGQTDLHPLSLPPAAILIVRALGDPRPGTLRLDRPSPGWQLAAREAVQNQLRRAARPRLGNADTAEAVLFADRAELLACLLRDWQAGATRSRWWWRLLGCDVRPLDWAAAELAREPEWQPPMFTALAEQRALMPLLRTLDARIVQTLLITLCRRFALIELEAVVGALPAPFASSPLPAEDLLIAPSASWAPLVRTGGHGGELVAAGAQLLATVALALQHAPAMARSRAFTAEVSARIDHASRGRSHTGDVPLEAQAAEPPPAVDEPVRRSVPPRAELAAADRSTPPARAANGTSPEHERAEWPRAATDPLPVTDQSPRLSTRIGEPVAIEDRAAGVPSTAGSHDAQLRGAEQRLVAAQRAADPPAPVVVPAYAATRARPVAASQPADAETPVPPDGAWPRIVESELGGLFFLVNLALFLDLYGDFAEPRHVDLGMPLFDFVTLLGRDLAGDDDDPIWTLFAELAGRAPDEPVAGGFVPPVEWEIPDDWLVPFADDSGDWSITARAGRLQLLHPAGFIAIEIPQERAAPSLSRWLEWVVRYCRARLIRATGHDDLSALWRRRARVFVTGARIDVELTLDDHPIEVRIAGLDRDPGWLPATGRDLRFHFR